MRTTRVYFADVSMEIDAVYRKAMIIALLASTGLLAACNTVKGVGRDIESVGSAGEKAINK